ncbi:acyl-coenzyme a oxidase 2 [Nadsonia fulvescens var. elongata DSM 6958]|uniref:Acyl-coenzyme A oxidase n=1 Tax=Nadsonia fulvescens var. elongata DSM 6958 TaxID=857566 RepID=A0A1E3PRP2_9ASCO|nr:acyl-coenzyme a oxidase 2 [Nadsonia fulvescens var. elongata DSM 6958]
MSDRLSLMDNLIASKTLNQSAYNTFTEPPVLMAAERAATAFDTRSMTHFLDGGAESTAVFEKIMLDFERDPVFNNDNYYDLSKSEVRKLTMQRIARLVPMIINDSEEDSVKRFSILGICDMSTYTRTGVHFGLFFGAIRGSGTTEQFNYWIGQGAGEIKNFFGCFCMTELGHGSNVAALETTAVWDEQTDEFIINTPHVGATKWWIGGAAHSATHTACFARLIVKGKDYGVKIFIVPLRNVADHSLRAGISLGDIGKKMGRDGIDNGWVQFTNVRIPRQFMLMKYAQVDRAGNVTMPVFAQLTYGALIGGRVNMVADSFQVAKRFITIAIRYAAVRRQFAADPKQTKETRILDYTYHQRRLIPLLAYTYAMKAASDELNIMYRSSIKRLEDATKSSNPEKKALAGAIEDVKELFSTSAGCKAFCTWATADIIDETRQSCGGHGYSGYNGFGQAYNDWVVQCTWEGDNNILTLSAGRALIQSCLSHRRGKPIGDAVKYLQNSDSLKTATVGDRALDSESVLREAWQVVASNIINAATDKFTELTTVQGLSLDQAMEEISQQRFLAAKIHTRQHLIRSFFDRIKNYPYKTDGDNSIREHLANLAKLFALWSIEQDTGLFLHAGYLTPAQIDSVGTHVTHLCKSVRDQAIGLTDAFNLSDYFINAPIGNYDGNVYKHYYEKVNRANPAIDSKPEYYESTMKPFLQRGEEECVDLSELE